MARLPDYAITTRLLTGPSKRRSMRLIAPAVQFLVAHDTGNPGSTAAGNVGYYESSRDEMSASAHFFVDDKDIIECIPVLSGPPEKAWHVMYDTPLDNEQFGDDANDVAIGVEYCYGGRIHADEAYARYVYLLAFLCRRFRLDPNTAIVGHHMLDPRRKIDPENGLRASGRSYEQLLRDVPARYSADYEESP